MIRPAPCAALCATLFLAARTTQDPRAAIEDPGAFIRRAQSALRRTVDVDQTAGHRPNRRAVTSGNTIFEVHTH